MSLWDDEDTRISMDFVMETVGDFVTDAEASRCSEMSTSNSFTSELGDFESVGRKRSRNFNCRFDVVDDVMVTSRSSACSTPPLSPITRSEMGTCYVSDGFQDLNVDENGDECDNETDDTFCSRSLTSADSTISTVNSRKSQVPELKSMKILRPLPDQSAFECPPTDRSSSSVDSPMLMSPCPPTPFANKRGSSSGSSTGRRMRSNTNSGLYGGYRRSRSCSEGSCGNPRFQSVGGYSAIREEDITTLALDTTHTFWRCDGKDCEQPVSFRNDFDIVSVIGRGCFAEVLVVAPKNQPILRPINALGYPGNYVIKRLIEPLLSPRDRETKLMEPKCMFHLMDRRCMFIVDFIMAWQENENLFMLLEYCHLGSLQNLLGAFASTPNAEYLAVPESFLLQVLHNVSQGLLHIHTHCYIHMDIKPANLLISSLGHIKIADFGRAVIAGMGEDGQEGDQRYTIVWLGALILINLFLRSYMAPELLTSNLRHPSADIFSLGLTVLELANARAPASSSSLVHPSLPSYSVNLSSPLLCSGAGHAMPFQITSAGELWQCLRKDDVDRFIPNHVSSFVREIICGCMSANYLQRCSANDILHSDVGSVGIIADPFLTSSVFRNNYAATASSGVGLRRSGSFSALESCAEDPSLP
jgi:serine/threonine protein kinase